MLHAPFAEQQALCDCPSLFLRHHLVFRYRMWGILNSLGLAQKSGKSELFMLCWGGCFDWHCIVDQIPKVSREADVVL
jgi:hypothetical protein